MKPINWYIKVKNLDVIRREEWQKGERVKKGEQS